MLTELGVFRELYREHRPVVVNPADLGADAITKQRVAIAVRAGDEVLGSIWAAMDGEVTPERSAALQDAAKLVALHMLRVRAGADVQRRLRTDLVSTRSGGRCGRAGRAEPARPGRQAGRRARCGPARRDPGGVPRSRPPSPPVRAAWTGDSGALPTRSACTCRHPCPGSAVAVVGGIAYGLLPSRPAATPRSAPPGWPTDFCERVGSRLPIVVGIGGVGDDVRGVAESRATATRVLRVLREGHAAGGSLACPTSSRSPCSSSCATSPPRAVSGRWVPSPACSRTTSSNDADLIETLEAWLDALRRRPRRRRRAVHPPQHAALPAAPARGGQRTRPRRPGAAVRGDAPAADPRARAEARDGDRPPAAPADLRAVPNTCQMCAIKGQSVAIRGTCARPRMKRKPAAQNGFHGCPRADSNCRHLL